MDAPRTCAGLDDDSYSSEHASRMSPTSGWNAIDCSPPPSSVADYSCDEAAALDYCNDVIGISGCRGQGRGRWINVPTGNHSRSAVSIPSSSHCQGDLTVYGRKLDLSSLNTGSRVIPGGGCTNGRALGEHRRSAWTKCTSAFAAVDSFNGRRRSGASLSTTSGFGGCRGKSTGVAGRFRCPTPTSPEPVPVGRCTESTDNKCRSEYADRYI